MAFGGSAFGQSSSSLFGAPTASVFGDGGAGATGLFGASSSAFGASGSTFGQSIPSANTLWPGQQSTPAPTPMPPDGSRAAKWQISTIHDSATSADSGKYLTISAMPPFRNFSVEEIRLHDYARGDKAGDQPQTSAFGSFAQPSQPAFGAPAQGLGASAPAFGASSASAFGAGIFGAASQPAFPAGGFGASSAPGFGPSSAFGPTSTPAFGATAFGASSAAAPSLFGAPASQSSAGLFGAPAAQSATGLFGAPAAQSATGLFGAPAAQSAAGLFGAPVAQSATGLFGAPAAQSTSGLFGAPAQQKPAGGLFGAPASSAPGFGASGAFGPSFGGAASAPQSAPSLFGTGASTLTGFGAASRPATGAGLFGAASTGASLFASTGGSLFSSAPSLAGGFGASSGGLFGATTGGSLFGAAPQAGYGMGFGSSFGAGGAGGFGFGGPQQQLQQQQQPQGPLQASLTTNPFGDSKLFSGAVVSAHTAPNGAGASVISTPATAGQSEPKAVSVVVKAPSQPYRRTRTSELLARQTVMRRRGHGSGWFAASPMRPWREEGSVFNVGTVLQPTTGRFGKARTTSYDVTPWRTEEQRVKAANLKRLVIDPMPDDPVLSGGGQLESRQVPDVSQGGPIGNGTHEMTTPTANIGEANGTPENPFRAFEALPDRTPSSATPTSGWDRGTEEEGVVVREADEDQNDEELYTDHQGPGSMADDGDPETSAQEEDTSQSPGRFVPYSEFYRNRMPGSGRRSSIGSDRNRRGSVDIPKCSDPDYYMIPSLEEMSRMSNEDLSHVEELTIGKKGMGEILWLEPVDVRGLEVDHLVQIKKREVSVYPLDEDVPPVGEGLNKPARIKLFGIYRFDKHTKEPLTDATTAAKMVAKLKAHCVKEGLKFLGYDVKTGTWTFQSSSF